MGSPFSTPEIVAMAVVTLVTMGLSVWPSEWRERAEYHRRLHKSKVMTNLFGWDWDKSEILLFVVLAMQAVGTGLYLLDPFNVVAPSTYFNVVVGVHWGALLIWRVAVLHATEAYHKYARRRNLVILLFFVFAAQSVSLGFLISEVATSSLETATSVLALIGWALLDLYLLLSLLIEFYTLSAKAVIEIKLIYKKMRSKDVAVVATQ